LLVTEKNYAAVPSAVKSATKKRSDNRQTPNREKKKSIFSRRDKIRGQKPAAKSGKKGRNPRTQSRNRPKLQKTKEGKKTKTQKTRNMAKNNRRRKGKIYFLVKKRKKGKKTKRTRPSDPQKNGQKRSLKQKYERIKKKLKKKGGGEKKKRRTQKRRGGMRRGKHEPENKPKKGENGNLPKDSKGENKNLQDEPGGTEKLFFGHCDVGSLYLGKGWKNTFFGKRDLWNRGPYRKPRGGSSRNCQRGR